MVRSFVEAVKIRRRSWVEPEGAGVRSEARDRWRRKSVSSKPPAEEEEEEEEEEEKEGETNEREKGGGRGRRGGGGGGATGGRMQAVEGFLGGLKVVNVITVIGI